jgi:FkbH-like protein
VLKRIRHWIDKDVRPSLGSVLDAPIAREEKAKPQFGVGYLMPTDLVATKTPLNRVLIIGSCQVVGLVDIVGQHKDNCEIDYIQSHNVASLPDSPPNDLYDFQIVQLPVRGFAPEQVFMGVDWNDSEALESQFREAIDRLDIILSQALKYNTELGITTFVTNFMVPQQSAIGRLLPRYSLANPVFFFESLNRELYNRAKSRNNVHILDVEAISSSLGRRWHQDDVFNTTSHSALISDFGYELDQRRMHPTASPNVTFSAKTVEILSSIWEEAVGMFRTLRQIDQVKLVVVDLDDTMWRGVLAEAEDIDADASEGWPIGFLEALSYLKKRGILLAIISKNDETRAKAIWDRVYGKLFPMDQFALTRINWRSKAENMNEILAAVNVLPGSVVFVDDNPVERAAVAAAHPGIRTLGAEPYHFRRVMLWSAETQVSVITAESGQRTEMIQAQVVREETRREMTHGDFLKTLGTTFRPISIGSIDHPRFARAIELINKSNQFNTTGKRWSLEECSSHFANGGAMFAFEVEDRFTNYGLVGVAIHEPAHITQYVMSCRVIGMEVETYAIGHLTRQLRAQGAGVITADLVKTKANALASDLWPKCGFTFEKEAWEIRDDLPGLPEQIAVAGAPA